MKNTLLAVSLLLFPLAAGANVTVEWVKPEKFTDAYSSSTKSEKSRQIILDDLQKFIVEQASRSLKEGQTLALHVTDVDLAGEFEPWTDHPDSRVVKSPFYARIAFSYTLTDADGKVIKEDKVSLINQLLTPPSLPDRDTQEPYLRDTLRDWFHVNLR